MKRNIAILIFIFILSIKGFAQTFYDLNNINTIEINFEESNWDYLLDQLVSAGEEERLIGSVVINGMPFDSVGIRYKGNSSYRANQVKNPLNIKLDHLIKGQKLEGYGTLKLSNVYKDPSFIREVLSYELARQYMPASQANYAKVYINGTYLGLYTNVQDVDKLFMKSYFNTSDNVRVKGEIQSGLQPGQMGGVWEYFGSDSSSYFHKYALESDFGWNKLVEFLDTLNNQTDQVEKVLNVDRHLWFLAFSNLMVNLDGPINNPQNFYLFEDQAGRFNPIIWDLNENFGVFTNLQSGGPLNTSNLYKLDPFVNSTNSDYPVISKILNNEKYRKIYVAHMKTIMEDNFANGWYIDRGTELQQIIGNEVQSDPNKFYTYANFVANLNSAVGSPGPPPSGGQIVGISQLMDARINYLSGLQSFQFKAPTISDVSHNPENSSDPIWVIASVTDAENVYVKFREKYSQLFLAEQMLDDGNHGDGQAGDGIFGALLNPSGSLDYYIYAENNDAVSFSPARAEYEFYTMEASNGDLVINEFMADNVEYQTDQDGDFDDWIELFNNGTEPISLQGCHLSDDAGNPGQWIFPDTIIMPKDYIIIWADKDDEQEGLHANFKLSKSGESILLSDPDMNILDQIHFSEQQTDISTGRFPNGTGDFMEMNPTLGSENSGTTTGNLDISTPDSEGFITFPNPFVDKLRMNITLDQAGYINVYLTNNLGQLIMVSYQEYLPAGTHEKTFESSDLCPGLWIATLVTGESITTRKVVKAEN